MQPLGPFENHPRSKRLYLPRTAVEEQGSRAIPTHQGCCLLTHDWFPCGRPAAARPIKCRVRGRELHLDSGQQVPHDVRGGGDYELLVREVRGDAQAVRCLHRVARRVALHSALARGHPPGDPTPTILSAAA